MMNPSRMDNSGHYYTHLRHQLTMAFKRRLGTFPKWIGIHDNALSFCSLRNQCRKCYNRLNLKKAYMSYTSTNDYLPMHTGPDWNGLVQKYFLGFFYYKETSYGQKCNIPVHRCARVFFRGGGRVVAFTPTLTWHGSKKISERGVAKLSKEILRQSELLDPWKNPQGGVGNFWDWGGRFW